MNDKTKSMKSYRTTIFSSISTLALMVMLNGCVTTKVLDTANKSETIVTNTEVLKDRIIAVGLPSKPIKGYENVLVLAGDKHSYLIQPNDCLKICNKDESFSPPDLFMNIYQQVDLSHVYIVPVDSRSNMDQTQKASTVIDKTESQMTAYVHDSDIENGVIKEFLNIAFIKPVAKLKPQEHQQLESLGFTCKQKIINQDLHLACENSVAIAMTVATKVQNHDTLQHTFKQPVNLIVYHEKKNESSNNKALLLLPISIAFDLVTLPVQAGVAYAFKDFHFMF